MKKYEIIGQLENGAILAKTNVPMNKSGEAVKKLVDDLFGGLDYGGMIECLKCGYYHRNAKKHKC